MSYNSKTQGEHVTGNCKGNLSNHKVLKGCKTEMTDVWPNSSHQILTSINAELSKVSHWLHTVRSKGSKCWNMFNRLQKYLGIKFIQILRARTNSQVPDPPQMSAICDVVAQLIYLSNSCSVYVITPGRTVLLGAKECDGHQKEKNNSINTSGKSCVQILGVQSRLLFSIDQPVRC